MTGGDSATPRPAARWPWAVLIVGVVLLGLLVWGVQVGVCADAAEGSGRESYCSSGSVVGLPAAIVLTVLGLLAIGFAVYRLARRS